MKKILISLLILPIFAFAGLDLSKVNETLEGIMANKDLSFYSGDSNIKLRGKLKIATLENADIVIFSKHIKSKQVTIVNSYKELQSNKNSIGAIYLKKGRTQIVFIKERLDEHGLVLSHGLKKHLIHEWQLDKLALLKKLK